MHVMPTRPQAKDNARPHRPLTSHSREGLDRRTKSGGPAPHPTHKRPPPGATANKPDGGRDGYVRGAAKRNGERAPRRDGQVRGRQSQAQRPADPQVKGTPKPWYGCPRRRGKRPAKITPSPGGGMADALA
ncbi:hypothetical protein HEK616_46450 [Streptomyces nigrescens]|uniref:Uncharacterized protein n=1 Tax=Streptomyces nigrescens TaxID=1920 RepID=A0ABN6QY88_STRNI|nr:hypothetical protein HEK616_46450 [Streptomyces nigrescens]